MTDDERRRNLGAFFHSIHRTLNHLLLTDRHWMSRFAEKTPLRFRAYEGAKLEPVLGDHGRELYPDLVDLRREREATDAVLSAWLEELRPETLEVEMRYRNTQGGERVHPLWFAMAHFFQPSNTSSQPGNDNDATTRARLRCDGFSGDVSACTRGLHLAISCEPATRQFETGARAYQVSMQGRFLPVRASGGGAERSPEAIHRRESAGSITSSISKVEATLTAFPC
jgi:uncharacterized damage-inducible protein DinB